MTKSATEKEFPDFMTKTNGCTFRFSYKPHCSRRSKFKKRHELPDWGDLRAIRSAVVYNLCFNETSSDPFYNTRGGFSYPLKIVEIVFAENLSCNLVYISGCQ